MTRWDRRSGLTWLMAGMAMLASAGGACAADKMNVAITSQTMTVAPVYIALDKGYFAKEGLDVHLLLFTNGDTLTTTIISGDADAGCTGFTAGFFNVADAGDLKAIAAMAKEQPGYHSSAYVASIAAYNAGLRTPADLKGKRIGINSLGGTLHYDLLTVARKYGFTVPRGNIIVLQSGPNELAAMQAGSIDASVMVGLYAVDAQNKGLGKVVGWVGDETPFTSIATFTNATTLRNHKDMLVRFQRAILLANADYNAAFQHKDANGNTVYGPEADALIALLAKDTQLPPSSVKGSLPYVDPTGNLDPADIANQLASWQSVNLVKPGVNVAGLLDLSVLKAAQSGQ